MKMKRSFFAILLVTMVLVSAYAHAQSGQEDLKEEVLHYVNQHRTSMGLQALKTNEIIEDEAAQHSKNMAKGRIPFGHDGFDERMGRIMKQIRPSHASAENVLEGAKTAKEAVDIWLHSPGHRKNIEGNYTLTGIGLAQSRDGKLYFTQIFILNK